MSERQPDTSPPALFLRFFRWFCNPGMRDYIEGDLTEVYRRRVKTAGTTRAKLRFISDVLLLFRPGIVRPLKLYKNLITVDMLTNYFKMGWRNLSRSKGYSMINISGLAIGIAMTILISLWVYDELSYDKYNTNYDHIAQVVQNVNNNGELQTWKVVPFPLAEELRANYGSDFKRIVMAVQFNDHLLSFNDKTFHQLGAFFEEGGPTLLDLRIINGSAGLQDPASLLLSASAARSYFGNDDPIGKIMKIDDMPVVKVAGVYADLPNNSKFAGLNFITTWDFYYKNTEWLRTIEDSWRPNFAMLFVELKDNADFSSVSLKIRDAKLKKVNAELEKKKPALFLSPMSQWHLRSEFKNGVNTGGAIEYVWMLGIIGAFVLLLACINFMNLSTARNEKRAKEVGIRKTIGSAKMQLVIQFFSESFLTVAIAFLLGLIMAQAALPFFNQITGKNITILWGNPWLAVIGIGFIIFTALIAGSYPAFYLSSFKPVAVLKGSFKAGRFSSLPRKVLVILQFAVSITLTVGTIIVYQQIHYSENRPVGYARENLINVTARSPSIHEHFTAIKNELISGRVITSIAESQSPTTAIWNSTSGLSWPGKDPEASVDFGVVYASTDYGKTIGWHIKSGRDFSNDFASDTMSLILNEAAVRIMNIENPIGQSVTWFGSPFTIVGIVHDMVMTSAYEEVRPVIYGNLNGAGSTLLIRPDPTISAHVAIRKIEDVIKRFDTDHPFEYQFVDDEYAAKFGNERRIATLASIFSALAVFISCLGIFGLASFVAEQRTKEIGVRKVMGASVFGLWKMLSGDFLSLVVTAMILSIPVSYYVMSGWLMNYQYRTEISWTVFLIAGVSAIAVTLLTVSYQSVSAARANPVKSLRPE